MSTRIAFRMTLLPGWAREYEKRHDEIWPALRDAIRQHGVTDYSIFLDEQTGDLFAVLRAEDEGLLATLADEPVVRRWWSFMAECMETKPDDAPLTRPLREVFRQA